jgi:hypothetical protein
MKKSELTATGLSAKYWDGIEWKCQRAVVEMATLAAVDARFKTAYHVSSVLSTKTVGNHQSRSFSCLCKNSTF